MSITRAIPLATSNAPETKNYLITISVSKGDWLSLAGDGKVYLANKSDTNRVVGVSTRDIVGGSLQTVSVQTKGLIINSSWNLSNINKPVYINTNGSLTQSLEGFSANDLIIEVGFATATNQVSIDIQTPLLNQVAPDSALTIASKILYAALANKANLDPNLTSPVGVGDIAVFTSQGVLAAAGDLQLPSEGGRILTDRSTVAGSDFN